MAKDNKWQDRHTKHRKDTCSNDIEGFARFAQAGVYGSVTVQDIAGALETLVGGKMPVARHGGAGIAKSLRIATPAIMRGMLG